MVLDAVVGGLFNAGRHLVNSTDSEIDGAGLAADAFLAVRGNTATQTFEKRFSSIGFKVKRQKLHREDIRDLTELTTARMEIYQLVGTLLLAFCMGWYTDSSMWDLPVWFTDLWLISNFAAVGYLLICVWLSMYAAVAARSVSTRLLTSYARLSIPTQAQLDGIKNPIFFNAREAVKKLGMRVSGAPDLDADPAAPPPEGGPKPPCPPGPPAAGCAEEACEDHEQHFRVFLQQLPKWLVYDTWARVCMSFGMNQMLQTLSYFSLGTLWKKSPMLGMTSFVSINVLATIILWLDIGDRDHRVGDYVAVFFLNFVPPLLVTILLLYETFYSYLDVGGRVLAALLVVACFFAHGGWLYYLESLCATAGSKESRFKPGNFANVLEWIRPPQEEPPGPDEGGADAGAVAGAAPAAAAAAPSAQRCGGAQRQRSDGSRTRNISYRPSIDVARDSEDRAHLIGYGDTGIVLNGGREPGSWARDRHSREVVDADHLHSMSWLPVRAVTFFTYFTISWWVVQGFVHGCMIGFDGHNTMESFTGSDDMSLLLENAVVERIEWPAPARLFKVAALFCGGSELLVSNRFSMYAIGQNESTGTASSSLSLVKDAPLSAVICGARGCDALSPPSEAAGPWTLVPLAGAGAVPTQVPIPVSWRLVAGAWEDCPQESDQACSAAWLAGWDGGRVLAARLELNAEERAWGVRVHFEVDPAVGRPGTDSGLDCSRPARHEQPAGRPWTVRMPTEKSRCEPIVKYSRVTSLQMSNRGRSLIVLDRGIADVWDLSQGLVLKRLRVGGAYSSMCQSGRRIFLSSEGASGPVVSSLELPPAVASLLALPPPPGGRPPAGGASARARRSGTRRSLRSDGTGSTVAAVETAVAMW